MTVQSRLTWPGWTDMQTFRWKLELDGLWLLASCHIGARRAELFHISAAQHSPGATYFMLVPATTSHVSYIRDEPLINMSHELLIVVPPVNPLLFYSNFISQLFAYAEIEDKVHLKLSESFSCCYAVIHFHIGSVGLNSCHRGVSAVVEVHGSSYAWYLVRFVLEFYFSEAYYFEHHGG